MSLIRTLRSLAKPKTMLMILAVIVAIVVVVYGASKVLNQSGGDVTRMAKEFFQKGGSDEGAQLVLFYAPWCPHCESMMGDWDEVTKKHKDDPNFTVKKVDCDANPDAAKENEIESFPTIVLFMNGKKIMYDGGDRSVDSIENFISSKTKN